MTATKFMAIYSMPKKMLRRKIVFAQRCYGAVFMEWWRHDGEFHDPALKWLLPGEDFVLVDMDYYWQGHEVLHARIDYEIHRKHGVYAILPGDLAGRCAMIDPQTGVVRGVIMADDELDTLPGMLLRNDRFAIGGDVYDFKRGMFRKPLRLVTSRRALLSSAQMRLAA